MMETKGALRSWSIRGALASSIGTIVGIVELVKANPELVEDTRFLVLSIIALVGQAVAIYGRWEAKTRLKGLI